MDAITQWANRWGISRGAIASLHAILNVTPTPSGVALSESIVSQQVRMTESAKGNLLWRNNVGVGTNQSGTPIRYGLANDSKRINSVLKSSDLIGITPVDITSDMVGSTIGQFTAREVKAEGWVYSGTAREVAQMNFLTLVTINGGNARFTTGI